MLSLKHSDVLTPQRLGLYFLPIKLSMAARTLTSTLTKPCLSSPPPSDLITSVTKILQKFNPQQSDSYHHTPYSSSLSQFSPHLTTNFVIHVINSQTDPFHSLFFFNWAANPSPNPNNYYHTFQCHLAMLDRLLSHRLFTAASTFLESHGQLCDFTISKVVKAHGDRSDIRGAIHWFHRAKLIGSGKCIFSYNSILGVLVKANRFTMAHGLFDQMVKEGVVRPDVSTYTTMIKCFCKMGSVGSAQKMFGEMPCRPNVVACNTMIDGLGREGLMKEAREIVDRMITSQDCLPDTVTYTSLINGYCSNGEVEEAMKCMDEMVSHNCEPDVITYNAIVNGLSSNGNVDEAKLMMTKMRLKGLKDNVATHTSILKGMCAVGRLDDAVKHLQYMISLGMKLDVKAYGVLLNAYCKNRKPKEAMMLLREMNDRGIKASVSSFNAVLSVLIDIREIDRAIYLLKQMPEMGCSPNFLSYFTVISSLCKTRGKIEQVEELFHDMLRSGHMPDAAMYSCLIKRHCEISNGELAVRLLWDAVNSGYVIDLDSFAALVQELCVMRRVFEAETCLEVMSQMCRPANLDKYRKVLQEMDR